MPDSPLDRGWALADGVALRPEPFGALAYHFGTRRLSFLKSPKLVAVVQALADHPTGRDACAVAGVRAGELAAFERALGALAQSGMIRGREGS
jgi:putative mycofactocin binding protein MftB